jgi:glycosyltransferase involved in cell wall biosynthesis
MIHYITSNGVGNAWVGNELTQLARHSIPFVLHSLHRPKQTYFKSPAVNEINHKTRFIYPISPVKLVAAVCCGPFVFGTHFWFALLNSLFGRKESFSVRLKSVLHFAVACVWARSLLGKPVSLIHSQWVNSCGTVAMYAAWLLDKPFSFTGHAADLFRERCALKDKIVRAKFIVCISTFHRDFYIREGADPDKLIIAYCGIDTALFKPAAADSSDAPVRIISAARLVEKKGLRYLIEACQQLVGHESFTCTIAGSGPLLGELREQIDQLGLSELVFLTGKPILQEEIPAFMASGDIYCLPCVWSDDGDVDGLPQMLMEAMACGVPVISTHLAGIPDLIEDGLTGLLVEPNNATDLSQAITRLADDRALRQQLAEQGRQRVIETFDIAQSLQPLLDKYRRVIASGSAA